MKHILCYGDSNTFGTDPIHGGRHPDDVRWTGVLQKLLGSDYRVIEEGCGGRTTVFEDEISYGRNGLKMLIPLQKTKQQKSAGSDCGDAGNQ